MPGRLADLLWPRRCEACGAPSDRPGRHVCSDCLNRIPFMPADGCCRKCGRDADGLDGEFLCEDCRTFRPAFDRAASAVRFDGDAREMVNAFKFRGNLWLKEDLADWLEGAVRARFKVGEIDAVASVPSTWQHRWDRGYGQCSILARALAKRIGKRYLAFAMRRRGNPKRQGGLGERERRENAKGTFATVRRGAVAGRTILVVDDIMTTGATLSECAAELKRAGAERVWCATVARSVR